MRHPRVRLALCYAAIFTIGAVQLPFWPLWLASRGLSELEVGVVLALGIWVRALAWPLAGAWADASDARRRVMRVLAGAGVLLACAFVPAHGVAALAAVTIAFALCVAPLGVLCDSIAVLLAQQGRGSYARARLWGSVSFLVTTLAVGQLISGSGIGIAPSLLVASMALTALATLALPDIRAHEAASRRSAPLRLVLGVPDFVPLLLAIGVVQASHAAYYGYSTIWWRAAGWSERAIGGFWAVGVVGEILFFRFGARAAARLGVRGLLLVGALGAALRWSLFAQAGHVALVAGLQLLHAASFGATHLAMATFIEKRVPAALASSANSLYATCAWGLGLGAATAIAGLLYTRAPGLAFAAMAALALAGALGGARVRDGRRAGVG